MNKMISLAKVMFAGLAVYLSISVIRNILITIILAFQDTTFIGSIAIVIFSLLLSCAYLVAIFYFLVLKSDKWTRKLIAGDIDLDSSPTPEITLTTAFRLVSIGAGIYCTSSVIWSSSRLLSNLIRAMKYQQDEHTRTIFTGGFSVDYIQPLLYLALAIYLLCGAPHFVRWQVKKTMQFCNEQKDLNKQQTPND